MDDAQLQLIYRAVVIANSHMLPAPGGVSPVHLTDSVSKASYAVGAAMVYTQPTTRHLLSSLRMLTISDTLFRKVRYSSHHLLHTLLPEQTTHSYHLRSRTHSCKLSSQHDERNFIDRMLF